MKDINTLSKSSNSKYTFSTILVFLSCVTICLGQSARKIAYAGMDAAKEGTFIVCIETHTKNLQAIDHLIENSSNQKNISSLLSEKQRKEKFREIYEISAKEAFADAYHFGKYQIVYDTDLKEVRDSLSMLEEPYIILIKRNDVRELGVINSNNIALPLPFPQYFDGLASNLGELYRDGETNQKAYTNFFKDSITKLDRRLSFVHYRLNEKVQRKEQRKKR